MSASVGNSMAKEGIEKNYRDMRKFTFLFSWFCGWCTVCMCCLYQPFMLLWMRGDTRLLLSNFDMFLFCIYFYAISMNNIRNQYLNGAGIYWELRLWYFLEAVGNIILNYALGCYFGITGILLATLITVVVFNFIARTNVLFKMYFKDGLAAYYLQHLRYVCVLIIGGIATYGICMNVMPGIAGLLIRGAICLIVPNIIYFVAYCRTECFREAMEFIKHFWGKG